MGLGADTPGTSKNPTTQKAHGRLCKNCVFFFFDKNDLTNFGGVWGRSLGGTPAEPLKIEQPKNAVFHEKIHGFYQKHEFCPRMITSES